METPSIAFSSKSAGIECRATVSASAGNPGQTESRPASADSSSSRQASERGPCRRRRPARPPDRRCASRMRKAHTSNAAWQREAAGKRNRSSGPLAAPERRRIGSWPGVPDPSSWRILRPRRCRGALQDACLVAWPIAAVLVRTAAEPGHPHGRDRAAQQAHFGPPRQGRPAAEDVKPSCLDPIENRRAPAGKQVDVDGQCTRNARHQGSTLGQEAREPARPRTAAARRTRA